MEMKPKKLMMMKDKQPMQLHNPKQVTITKPSLANRRSDDEAVKLVTIATSLNVRLRSSDMPPYMQERALLFTRSFLDSKADSTSRPNPTQLARALKKEFDSLYGPAWHCVVGKSFGSFVTHSPGGFVYFSIDSLSVLVFKTEVQLVTQLK